MSYTRPDHDMADASWLGLAPYARPDHDAADATWEVAPAEGAIVAVVGVMPYAGSVVLEHAASVSIVGAMPYGGEVLLAHAVAVMVSGAMPYSGEVLLEHLSDVEVSIAGAMPYAGAISLAHQPPVAVGVTGTMPYMGEVLLGHYPLVSVSVAGAMPYASVVQLRHQAPRPVIYSTDAQPEYIYVGRWRYTTDGYDERELLATSGEGFTTRAHDDPPNTYVPPTLLDPGWLRREMSSGAAMVGPTRASFGQAQLTNLDGTYDHLDAYGFDGRRYTLYIGEPGGRFPEDFDVVFEALCGNRLVGTETVDFPLLGFEGLLDKPIASGAFAGTGGLEGPEALAGQPMPRYYGLSLAGSTAGIHWGGYTMPPVHLLPPPAVPLVLVDAQRLIYLVCDNPTQPLTSSAKWNVALDGGMPFSRQAPYASLDDLLDDDLAPEPGAARFFHAGPTYVRLGTRPIYAPSALPGNAYAMDGGFPDFERIAQTECGAAIADYSEYAAFAGYFQDGTTYLQAMSDCAPPQLVFFGFTLDGKFFARQLREPEAGPAVFEFSPDVVIKGSLRRMLPTTAPLPVNRVDFRGVRNPMHGQTLSPAVWEEDYPDYFDPGTTVIGPVADVRVIAVLHWLLKEYATDKAVLPPPPAPPPPPGEALLGISGRQPYEGFVSLHAPVGMEVAGRMPYVGDVRVLHMHAAVEVAVAGVMAYAGSLVLDGGGVLGSSVVFDDHFGGSGALGAHAPDVTTDGLYWYDDEIEGGLSLSDGVARATGPVGLSVLINDDGYTMHAFAGMLISWVWVAPTSWPAGHALEVEISARHPVGPSYAGESIVVTSAMVSLSSTSEPIEVTPGEIYPGSLQVFADGSTELVFLGAVISGDLGVGALSSAWVLQYITLRLRGSSGMSRLIIEVPDA